MVIKVNLPYPSIDGLIEDRHSASALACAYAGHNGELKAVLQYVYHYFYFKRNGDDETAEVVMGIAICEMEHLKLLGEILLKIGVDPVYTKFPPFRAEYFNTFGISYSKVPEKMLIDDITMEMASIDEYEKMERRLKDERLSAIIKRIALDEQLHVKALSDRLSTYKGNGGRTIK